MTKNEGKKAPLINGKTAEQWGEMDSTAFMEELAKLCLVDHKWQLNEVKMLIIRHIHTCMMGGSPNDAVAVMDYITHHGLKVDSTLFIKFDKKRGRPSIHLDGIFKAGCEMLDSVFSSAVEMMNIKRKSKRVACSDFAREWEVVPHIRLARAERVEAERVEAECDEAECDEAECDEAEGVRRLVKRMKLMREESREENRVIIALLKQLHARGTTL